jgi:hypothetical protein
MLAAQGQTALDVPEGTLERGIGMMEAMPEIATVPPILKRSVVAPYIDGLGFVHTLRRDGGWSAVDAAWRDPPTTTEQILHPEKYAVREAALKVAPPRAPAGGPSDAAYSDQLGEQGLRLVLEEWMPLRTAALAASGWGGDAIVVFATGDRRAVAAHLVFDDEEAAKRAFEGIARGVLLGETDGGPPNARSRVDADEAARKARGGRLCAERPQRGPFAILRRGRDLAVALGPFSRQGGSARSEGNCRGALAWAGDLLSGR